MCASALVRLRSRLQFLLLGGNIKRRHCETLQPLQGYERHAEWASKGRGLLAILWRHLSKVTRNYDYVRAQRVSGVALAGFEGVAGSQSDSLLRALPCFSFYTLSMPYTRA